MDHTFKEITDLMIGWFEGNGDVNEVTFGDINEVDITSVTNFPLVHIQPVSSDYREGFTVFNYTILALTTYESSKDDKVEVLSSMNEILTQFCGAVYKGSLFNRLIRTEITPTGSVVYDQFGNRLYGYSVGISLLTPNGLINCG